MSERLSKLFFVDFLGAVVSAFMLGIVLTYFQSYIGMPVNTLYLLAIIPCFYAAYSFFCYKWPRKNPKPYMRGIAFANLAYCLLTINLMFKYKEEITQLGFAYFIGEVIIILILVIIELKST